MNDRRSAVGAVLRWVAFHMRCREDAPILVRPWGHRQIFPHHMRFGSLAPRETNLASYR